MRWVICLVVLALAMGPQLASGLTSPAQLSLRLSLDHSEYLPGEPILIGITIENHGLEPFEDLSRWELHYGYLNFHLTRNGEKVDPWVRRHVDLIIFKDGPSLRSGERVCDVFDFLHTFFSRPDSFEFAGVTNRLDTLPAGSYSLTVTYRARWGTRLPQVLVTSNPLTFSVLDASAIPPSEATALELLRTPRPDPAKRWDADKASPLLQSRYTILGQPRLANSVNALRLAQDLSRGGLLLTAAQVLRYGMIRNGGVDRRACLAWLDQVAREDAERTFACFLETWKAEVTRWQER